MTWRALVFTAIFLSSHLIAENVTSTSEPVLSAAERTWLSALESDTWQRMQRKATPALPVANTPVPYSSVQASSSEHWILLPVSRMTFPQFANGVMLEQSGIAIQLPELMAAKGKGGQFSDYYLHWRSVDLSATIRQLQIAQSETGWSDYEWMELLNHYAQTLTNPIERQAFIAAFLHQADFGLRLWKQQDRMSILVRTGTAVLLPHITIKNQRWVSPFEPLPDTVVAISEPLPGQAMRQLGLHSRYAGSEMVEVSYRLPQGSRYQQIMLQFPDYWHKIQRLPVSIEGQFRQAQPEALYQSIAELLPPGDWLAKTQTFITFIRQNFALTEVSLSLQQSCVAKKTNSEARLLLLAGWLKQIPQGSLAIIEHQQLHYLAFSTKALEGHNDARFHRRKYWLIWSADLMLLKADQKLRKASWHFLP